MIKVKRYALWLLLAVITGGVCGLCGVVFSKAVGFVTDVRAQNGWLIYLLPIGGLISVSVYKLCRVKNIGTTNVFDCVRTEQSLPKGLALSVFCGTAISHLFGASVGREGAALQIGGGVANILGRAFKLDEDSRHITVMCGMAALFSAVFGTPLAAWIFVLEVILTQLCLSAAIPVLLSSVTAFIIATLLGIHPERFDIGILPQFSISLVWKSAIIVVGCIIASFVFCKSLSLGKALFKKILRNEFLRIAVGGVLIVALTLFVGNREYNGGGIDIIERVFNDEIVHYEAFALKILFTVICVSAGYKGGEIIPTLFIGATLGGGLALLLGLPVGTGAAIGMAVLFATATKCPFATILLCGEMFGITCVPLIIPVVIISFALSHQLQGLYSNSKDIINLIKKYRKKLEGYA
ncbi:MAG: chloride channel protein [Clostridia bacterium]|nr:chloride channel protein [Clostridia bacterium]